MLVQLDAKCSVVYVDTTERILKTETFEEGRLEDAEIRYASLEESTVCILRHGHTTLRSSFEDTTKLLPSVTQLRRLLSVERNPPIKTVIEAGLVPMLVQYLHHHENPLLQFETCWAITNIISGTSEQVQVVIDEGVLPVLFELISSPDQDVREQAIWAIGNIAGDSPSNRDMVLEQGVLPPLLAQIRPSLDESYDESGAGVMEFSFHSR
jgi:hypothetical protein